MVAFAAFKKETKGATQIKTEKNVVLSNHLGL
jgi:hypothetical protein